MTYLLTVVTGNVLFAVLLDNTVKQYMNGDFSMALKSIMVDSGVILYGIGQTQLQKPKCPNRHRVVQDI